MNEPAPTPTDENRKRTAPSDWLPRRFGSGGLIAAVIAFAGCSALLPLSCAMAIGAYALVFFGVLVGIRDRKRARAAAMLVGGVTLPLLMEYWRFGLRFRWPDCFGELVFWIWIVLIVLAGCVLGYAALLLLAVLLEFPERLHRLRTGRGFTKPQKPSERT